MNPTLAAMRADEAVSRREEAQRDRSRLALVSGRRRAGRQAVSGGSVVESRAHELRRHASPAHAARRWTGRALVTGGRALVQTGTRLAR